MLEHVTDTLLGNPVFAGLAAFSATSVTLAAFSWAASPRLAAAGSARAGGGRSVRPGWPAGLGGGAWRFSRAG
ncbi:hypothetical protein [Ensifer sp. 1H6]|uniref:hypothetical protein n=1 Tax=Ensifer sp. 1H6 TaxID=1911585 RepID=UPI0009C43E74|nr:hypothetical protein [Ensifer sp. 1H6]OMQ41841.1 hypothetical protein BKP54_26780 [Ensifer sp. 1H6]